MDSQRLTHARLLDGSGQLDWIRRSGSNPCSAARVPCPRVRRHHRRNVRDTARQRALSSARYEACQFCGKLKTQKRSAIRRFGERRQLLAGASECRVDVVESRLQLAAQSLHRRDDGNGNAGGDQAVFYRSGAGFVGRKLAQGGRERANHEVPRR